MSLSQPSSPSSRSKSKVTRKRSVSSDPPHKRTKIDVPAEPLHSLVLQCFDSTICDLSDNVLLQIFSNLNEGGIVAMGATSQRFHRISNEIDLWKNLYQRVFEYQTPLYHPRPREFEFREPSSWENVENPWKESFRQLRHGIHVRPGLAHIYARQSERSIRHFENLGAAIEHCNSLTGDKELLIFLHDPIPHSCEITITGPLQIIGAGSTHNFKASVIIENHTGTTVTFANGSDQAYLGYCTVKCIAPPPNTSVVGSAQPLRSALFVTGKAAPLIEYCFFSSNCYGGATVWIEKEKTNPQIRNSTIAGSNNVGIYVMDDATGTYEDCTIFCNKLAGVWVKNKANPQFRRCRIYGGDDVGIFSFDNGMGHFEECNIHNNRLAGIESKGEANPTVIRCEIHHGKTGGIYIHDKGSGQFIENRIFANELAGIWITSGSDPIVRNNQIFNGKQGGVYVFNEGRGVIKENNIYQNSLAGIEIRGGSNPIVRLNRIHDGCYGGIYVHESGKGLIEENEIYGNDLTGIWVTTESTPTIRRNRIYSGKQVGVYFYDNGHGILEENEIFNHPFSGIQIRSGSNPQITRNKIWGCQSGGVFVYNLGRGVLEDNEIFDSQVAGVWIKSEGNPILRGNKIYDGRDGGIYIFNKGRGLLEGNEIYRNAQAGVLISTDSNPVLRRNRIYKGRAAGIEITTGAKPTLDSNHLFQNEFGGLCLATDVHPIMYDNLIYDNHDAIDRTIDSGHCLFKISSRTSFPLHDYYKCKTCDTTDRNAICTNCIRICHREHDVEFVRRDRFFCDCGAGLLRTRCTLQARTVDRDLVYDSATPTGSRTA